VSIPTILVAEGLGFISKRPRCPALSGRASRARGTNPAAWSSAVHSKHGLGVAGSTPPPPHPSRRRTGPTPGVNPKRTCVVEGGKPPRDVCGGGRPQSRAATTLSSSLERLGAAPASSISRAQGPSCPSPGRARRRRLLLLLLLLSSPLPPSAARAAVLAADRAGRGCVGGGAPPSARSGLEAQIALRGVARGEEKGCPTPPPAFRPQRSRGAFFCGRNAPGSSVAASGPARGEGAGCAGRTARAGGAGRDGVRLAGAGGAGSWT
jgi:hypothetical protein